SDPGPSAIRCRTLALDADLHGAPRASARRRAIWVEGYRQGVPRSGCQDADAIRPSHGHRHHERSVLKIRVSLPHPGARGERDDAAVRRYRLDAGDREIAPKNWLNEHQSDLVRETENESSERRGALPFLQTRSARVSSREDGEESGLRRAV